MSAKTRLLSLWRGLFGKARIERELDEELRSYAEMLTAEKVALGMSPEDARRAATIEAGGFEQVKEQVRDVRAGALLETVLKDLRYGARALARTPVFTAAAVLALALGIGASTAIFSVVSAVLLRPLPYREPGQLTVLLHHGNSPVAPANFVDWRRQNTVFAAMGAADNWTPNLTGNDQPESIQAVRLTEDVLPMLGVQPALGRLFRPEETEPGREHEVILSQRLWQRLFGGDPKILGRPITLNGEPYTVVGVMPPEFQFPPFWETRTEMWAPLALGERAAGRGGQSLRVFARRKPGVALEQARAEMATITGRLEKEYPGTNRDVTVRSLEETVVGDVRPGLLVLLGAVAFVLLIACANVAHMLLARAAARQKEVAVRTALGASRSRLVCQFLTESLALALVGGAAGLALAAWGIRVLVALSPSSIPRVETIGIDGRVFAFALGVSLFTGIAFGLLPALQLSRRDAGESLREGERGSTEGPGRSRLRMLLVGSEFALALVLLVCAGLMIRSFLAQQGIDPGFNPSHVLTMTVSVAGTGEAEPQRRSAFFEETLRRVRALPGVRSAGAINHLPLGGDIWGWSFSVEGRPIPPPGESPDAAYRVVLPGYFLAMGIPILRGRDIAESDRLDAPGAIVINEFLANQQWPGENPLGKRITFDDQDKNPQWLTVVGVIKNAVRSDWAADPWGEVYMPYLQNHNYLEKPSSHWEYLTLVVRSGSDPAALTSAIRGSIASLDRNVTISQVQTMERVVADATAQPRFYLLLLATFAGTALILAALGIYGVMSYSVARRTHEIGIRVALGADRSDVLRLVVREAMTVALVGAAVGLAAAFALTRLMATLLYGVGSTDPLTFLAVSLVLTLVALAASYIPAHRATRIDPLTALRGD